jgi:hypothetical protein
VSQAPGYRLVVSPDDLDAARFQQLAAAGRRLLEADEPGRAAETLRQALALWRGGDCHQPLDPMRPAGVGQLAQHAWAALLVFHPAPDPGDIYWSLRDDPGRWLAVHVGTLFFIGLVGAAVLRLVDGLPGPAAMTSRRSWCSTARARRSTESP